MSAGVEQRNGRTKQHNWDEIFSNKGDISYIKWSYTLPADWLFFTDYHIWEKHVVVAKDAHDDDDGATTTTTAAAAAAATATAMWRHRSTL